MLAKDIDKIAEERIASAAKRFESGNRLLIEDLFTSEKFINALDGEINLMRGYQPTEVMAMLPFSQNLLVSVCPYCVGDGKLENFKKFVGRGAIIPILTAPYRVYPEHLVDFVSAHDHVSAYEYRFYKQFSLRAEAEGWVCSHCIEKSMGEALVHVEKEKNFDRYKFDMECISQNLWPFVSPDADLIKSAVKMCEKRDIRQLEQLCEVSEGVNAVREAQVFDAPILLRSEEFDALPKGIVTTGDEARRVSAEMKQFTLDGLGLRIPTDIDVNDYIELVSDYRPTLSKIVSGIGASASNDRSGAISMTDVQKDVMKINSEIERVKGLRRTVVLDACVGFYKDHPSLVTTGLVMCALGLSNHLIGCAVTGGASVARGAVQALTGKKEGPGTARLKNVVERDVLPVVDKLIAAYVGSEARAVSVLSLRRIIESRVAKSKKSRAGDSPKSKGKMLKEKLLFPKTKKRTKKAAAKRS